MKFVWEKFYQLFLTIGMIAVIIALSVAIKAPRNEMFHIFLDQLQLYPGSLVYFNSITIQINNSHFEQLSTLMKEPYVYSLVILSISFLCSLIFALILSFCTFLLPNRLRKIVQDCLYFLQSIPDVMFIFGTILFIIWIYQKTDVLILDPISGLDKVYVLPILVVSILPGIMLSQMTMLAIEEESQKTYVEYAKTKGLTMGWILLNHIFRNVIVTLFSNIQYFFWFLISNMLVVEYLFNTHGYFEFLYKIIYQPEIFFVCLVFLFIPFYLFDIISKFIIVKLTGEELI